MSGYVPSAELVSSCAKAIVSTLPFAVRALARMIPAGAIERVVGEALVRVVPMSLSTMASAQPIGTEVHLTRSKTLTSATRDTLIKRIAGWLVPSEVGNLAFLLHEELLQLAQDRFGGQSWHLEAREGEAVLIVTGVSFLKETGETAADALFSSFESLASLKSKMSGYLR